MGCPLELHTPGFKLLARKRPAIAGSHLNYTNGMESGEHLFLVAEDDQDFTLLLEAALEEGHIFPRLEIVNDGRDALNYLAGKAPFEERSRYPLPVLLMLDLKLPRLNGFEVLQWVRSRRCFDDLPVVVLTGSERKGESEHAHELGADGFHVKPFHFHELATLLKEIWESWSNGRHAQHAMAVSRR